MALIKRTDLCLKISFLHYAFSPTPRVSWNRKVGDMPSRKHEESFGQEMVIEDVQLDDAGEYECLAYNEFTFLHYPGGRYSVFHEKISPIIAIKYFSRSVNTFEVITARQRSFGKALFSVVSVCWGSPSPSPLDMFKFVQLGSHPSPYRDPDMCILMQLGPHHSVQGSRSPSDMFKLVHYVVSKRAVSIRLKCLLVYSVTSFNA